MWPLLPRLQPGEELRIQSLICVSCRRWSLNSRCEILFLFVGLIFSLHAQPSAAQAAIDPSLPEAPLPRVRSLLFFPHYGTVNDPDTAVAPLRPKQKLEMAYRETFDPSLLMRAGFVSGFEEALDAGPNYGPGARGFAELYGYNATNVASMFFFSDGVLPIVFHQDPRYFRKGKGPVKSRIWWALRSQAVAFSDKGKPMPDYAELFGYSISSALSDLYLPPNDVSFGKTMESIGIKEGVGFGLNLMHEFGGFGQIAKRLRRP